MARINAVIDLANENGIAVVTVDSAPVNALSADVRAGIAQAVTQAVADEAVDAVVLICAGRTFVAGADISEFGKPPREPSLLSVERIIEGATKPVIAAIHGTALGGGFELALSCHWRIAVPSAKCGLPEVKLGILPGAGGTQRLPRLVGVERALAMVTSGEHVGAQEALALGLFDELAPEGGLREAALAFARQVVAEKRPLRRVRDFSDKIDAARGKPEIFEAFQQKHARAFRGFKAPEYNIRCIEAAVQLPFDEGMLFERALFEELVSGTQSAAQRHVFFAERQAAKVADLPADTPVLTVRTVGIVGAGTMGGGIAMSFLDAGLPVKLVEASADALERGLATIRRNYASTVRKRRISGEDAERRMTLLTGSLTLDDLAACDLIVEAVFEDMAVKQDVFRRLDAVARDGAILATNTSYLDVNAIAAVTRRPEAVIGLHFFSPANIMRLLEVVRGAKTAPSVLATALALGKRLGKVAVPVGVCHGFVGNRMLAARQSEANRLILEGASPWDVDRVLYDFGFPMGPFAMSDLAGLDIGWSRATSQGKSVRDLLCERGRLGQKAGAGFYDYAADRTATPSSETETIIREVAARDGVGPRAIGDEEILERCILPMINEGARILEEGIAARGSDIDVVWVHGYGWPVYRGGPMFHADTIGLNAVVERLNALAAAHGPRFEAAPLLCSCAKEEMPLSRYGKA